MGSAGLRLVVLAALLVGLSLWLELTAGSAAAHPGSLPFVVSLAAVVLLTLIAGLLSRRNRRALAAR